MYDRTTTKDTDRELIEVLTAISEVSRRRAFKLERMQADRLRWQECGDAEEETVEFTPRPRRSAARRERRAALLDLWASMGILVMTLTFTVYVLCL